MFFHDRMKAVWAAQGTAGRVTVMTGSTLMLFSFFTRFFLLLPSVRL